MPEEAQLLPQWRRAGSSPCASGAASRGSQTRLTATFTLHNFQEARRSEGDRKPRGPKGLGHEACPSPFSLHTAPAPDPFLFPFTSTASSEGTRSPSQGRCASNPLARLVWVGFLRSNSCVFFCRFLFKMFPFSPPPLSRDGGGKKRKKKKGKKKKREVLNESQLAHTRGDGEICTKELPHSLAAFSSRNPAGRRACSPPCITRGAADKGAWP